MLDILNPNLLCLVIGVALLLNLKLLFNKYLLFVPIIYIFSSLNCNQILSVGFFILLVYFFGRYLSSISDENWQLKIFNILYIFLLIIFVFAESFLMKSALNGIGIGLVILQSISWLYDAAMKGFNARVNFLDYCLYMFFPTKIFIGPLESTSGLFKQIQTGKREILNGDQIKFAFYLIFLGIFKYLIVAGNIVSDRQYIINGKSYSLIENIFFFYLHFLKIYLSFSGLIEVIRGMSLFLGFELRKNFNKPLLAVGFSDYWARWHISLSEWTREYLFTPLSFYTRNIIGKYSSVLALIITFAFISLWHGNLINYWVFGLLHVILILVEKLFNVVWFDRSKLFSFKRFFFITLLCVIALFFSDESIFSEILININNNLNSSVIIGNNCIAILFSILLILIVGLSEIILDRIESKSSFIFFDTVMLGVLLLIILLWPDSGNSLIYLF